MRWEKQIKMAEENFIKENYDILLLVVFIIASFVFAFFYKEFFWCFIAIAATLSLIILIIRLSKKKK